ncbi:bifunctional DNA-formamidopyrimidine glycosylase/DNA-(apurinic or apyrimidinic site) lyase [Nitrospira sp. BLG_2]|uniref:bifunctional DNA-formamidopyrimidine glycosylase/DNA-(apurinic or apyrimidinic site) lyase n=1 Tax=Nitrospira sp. BLG_2 TaxID=3397507 RepID=UPI003B9A0CD0
MPELPEAEVVARQIRARLLGAQLRDVWVGRADIVREGLSTLPWYRGATLQSVDRFGKSVALGFANERTCRYVVAELGMTGLLLFQSTKTKYPQHIHVRLLFDGSSESELRYWNPRRFGRLSLLDKTGLERYLVRRFGVDPLLVSQPDFVRVLGERRGRLKSLLMHQQVIAGIGNIYANEILFRAGLHPNKQVGRLSVGKVERLYRIMREVLEEAISCGGSSVRDFFAPDGTEGQYKRRHLVYGKEAQPCPSQCGEVIRRMQGERSSYFCPRCQSLRSTK